MELGRDCEYSGMHLFYAQLMWELPVGIRILIALICLSTTTCVLAQQQPQREVRRPDGRVSVAVSPAMVQRLAELLGKQSEAQPEWAKIASEMLRGNPNMGAGYGWFGPAETRLDFEWLINKYDRDRNGRLVRAEMPKYLSSREFAVLDRDRDAKLTKKDVDWLSNPILESGSVQQVFGRLDLDSNGRITKEEMNRFFNRYAGGFDYLTPQDLRKALPLRPPPPPRPNPAQQAKMDYSQTPLQVRFQYLEMVLNGSMGLMEEGPHVGDDAPDFELPMMINDGDFYRLKLSGERARLSDSKGKRPVVLIFGSFT